MSRASKLRRKYRQELDEREERKVQRALKQFRDAMSTSRRDPKDIEAMARKLEARLRESKR